MSTTAQRPAPRPYRDFLTPALHRRFTSAVLTTLLVCCLEALWLGGWRRLWPMLGLAVVRTLLLFISSLAIYILRVAQLHIGARTTVSHLETFYQYIFRFDTLQTLTWYIFSAWWFSEVYIWSAPAEAKLGWIDPGKAYERPKLNERPVFLRAMFFGLAIAQSLVHLYNDYDRVAFPSSKVSVGSKDTTAIPTTSPRTELLSSIDLAAFRSALRALTVVSTAPFVYFFVLRRPAWKLAYTVVRRIVHLPKATAPSGLSLSDWGAVAGRFTAEGFLLTFLWEFSNTAFAAYVAQDPLKRHRLLTDDSKDPNGSLIAGLKARKEVPRSFAFWELVLLSHRFDVRRQTVYSEIERPGGATWSQILNICLAEINSISSRVQSNTASMSPSQELQQQPALQTLPKIATPPKDDAIFAAPPPANNALALAQSGLSTIAKSHSDPSNVTKSLSMTPQAKKLLEYGGNRLLPPSTQEQLRPAVLKSRANTAVVALLRSPLGAPLRQTFRRRVAAVVHGGPLSSADTIRDAAAALARLAACSLKEDTYGQVAKDVATIIKTFGANIKAIEGFVAGLEPHWTDIGFSEGSGRRVPEVEETAEVLRAGLEEVLRAFGEYSDGLGLSVGEMREAKEVVGRGRQKVKEMAEKKR